MRSVLVSVVVSVCAHAAPVAPSPPGTPLAWPDLDARVAVQGGGDKDAALVVGVTDYVFLPDIDGAADNAAAWQHWLSRGRGVKPGNLVILRDKEATRERIEKNLTALAQQVGAGGTLWFVFVGHGAPAPSGDDGLLLGVDADADVDSMAARGLPQERALALLGTGRGAHAVAVFDACFSGRVPDGGAPLVAGVQATLPVRRAAAPPTTTTTTTVLAASDSFAGPLPGQPRPAFSYLMLGALRGWADDDGDGAVTVDEATLFTRSTLQSAFKGDERLPQRRGPSFVLARGARERRPDVDGIVRATTASATRQLPAAAVATRLVVLPVRAAVAVDELRQPVMRAAARAAERLGLGVLDTEGYAKIATAAGCPIGDVDCGFRATRTQGAKVGLGLSFADEAVRATVLDVDGRVLGRASHPLSSGAGAAAREAAIGSVVDAAVTSALAGGPAAVTPAPASPAPPKSPTPPTPPKPSSSRSLSSPDSRVVLDFPCNIIRGIEGVGSQCTLRRGRLEVRPHPLNLQGAPEDILIVDIDRVEPFSPAGIVPTGVRLWLKDGSRRELVSWQRDQVVNELRALLAE